MEKKDKNNKYKNMTKMNLDTVMYCEEKAERKVCEREGEKKSWRKY